ncbi:MAG: hypothetical protein N3A69_07070 [Leptospiraceae bacterium]|nr:hypothetical protein [Leptospiraceae bacterium]
MRYEEIFSNVMLCFNDAFFYFSLRFAYKRCELSKKTQEEKGLRDSEYNTMMKDIEYKVLYNYFVRNDAKLPVEGNKITSREAFENVFGYATVMGKKGRPIVIDFKKEFVVPIILSITDVYTEIDIIKVSLNKGGDITIYYKINLGNKLTFQILPFKAIAFLKLIKGMSY